MSRNQASLLGKDGKCRRPRIILLTRLLPVFLIMAYPGAASAETVSGPAEVIDGDTLVVGSVRIGLSGIDAPELAQTCDRRGEQWGCGQEAQRQLGELIGSNSVQCTGYERDQSGRLLTKCEAGGYELNSTMVEYGWATAFRQDGNDYIAVEAQAKAARLGIWSSTFELPQAFRFSQQGIEPEGSAPAKAARASAPTNRAKRARCDIKGNRSWRGEWIYHLPGMPYYDATRPEEIFCSEAEAQAAGYRRALVR